MIKLSPILACVVASSASLSLDIAMAADDIESPKFEIELSDDNAELRRYAPMIAAEVQVIADDIDTAGSMGFMPLANYIFGNNNPGEKVDMTAPVTTSLVTKRGSLRGGDGQKIEMTAPVMTAPDKGGVYTVRFMMPSKWTMETLPAPVDERVSLVQVPDQYVVVAGFTGPKKQASIDAAELSIGAFVAANGLTPTGSMVLAGYSAPFVPDAQKKWEVHLKVEPPM